MTALRRTSMKDARWFCEIKVRRGRPLTMTDTHEALAVGRTSDGRLIHRPLSPHLQVYRWPITMALSILHRVTGVAAAIGTLLLTWWLVAAATSDHAYDIVSGFMRSGFGLLLLFGWTVALVYHFINGIRHLVWDAGYGFDKHEANRSSYIVLGLTALFTVAIWIAAAVVL
ncbi:Succinate dehydrogenase cytochrome b556 subunit [Granulibacter bethesdensis]|nr:Succinate dehydrogenase cytochrome b556 subunit [Granulibacter bethesdensis]